MRGEIRQTTSDEMASMASIWDACWEVPAAGLQTKEMPHYAPLEAEDVSVVFVDGNPVSCVAYGRKELLCGSDRVRLGALCNVATKLPHQRHGLASQLMHEAVQRMHSRGDHVSALFTYSFDFYRRFGWEIGGEYWDLLLYPAEFAAEGFGLPDCAAADSVRLLREDDLQAVASLHEAGLKRRRWGIVRAAAYWRWAREELDANSSWVVDRGNGIEGYLIAEVTPRLQLPDEFTFRRRDDPRWPLDLGPVLHIVELVSGTAHARRALLGYLARRLESVAALAYPLACRSDLDANGLLVPPARVRVTPSFMFRVLDAAGALHALSDLPPPEESFSVSILDPAGINLEPLAFLPNACGLEIVEGTECKHHLSMCIQAFSQLYAGYRTVADLCAQGRVNATSSRAAQLADGVFVLREPFIGELDLF